MSERRARQLEVVVALALLVMGGAFRLRVAHKWQFAGSDSYGYLKIADELRRGHRLALGPSEPLEYYRRPLYPAFLMVVKGDARTEASGGPGWERIKLAQLAIDLLIMCPLVWLVARRLSGRVGGLCALALAALWPTSVFYTSAALTESLAMTTTMVALAPLFLVEDRRVAFALGGVGVAIAALLRPEALVFGLVPITALIREKGTKSLLRAIASFAIAFLLAFAWWPARNLARFGKPHLADGMIDRFSRDVPNYLGFWRWLQSWATDDRPAGSPQACFYDRGCTPTPERLDTGGAYESRAERDEVARLLALRAKEGISPAVSDGFQRLAEARRARHRFAAWIGLPLLRAWNMWLGPEDELLQNPGWRPWPAFSRAILPSLRALSIALFAATVLAAIVLLAVGRTRVGALVLVVPLAARTLALAYSAFSLPRYLIPTYPISFVLVGAALGLGWSFAKARKNRAATSPS